MSGQDPPDEEDSTGSLNPNTLREYVRAVMDWTAYQAQAYVAVVQHGPLEPSDIVAMTDVPHGSVYNVMGELEGEAVNVQGRQPKRYQAQHPRSLLGDKQDEFNEKADAAIAHLEQQHEIQRERQDARHPAWVVPSIAGTKRELLEALREAEDRVLLMEQDGNWIQSNEMRDLSRLVDDGVRVEVVGWSGWRGQLEEFVEETGASGWVHEQVNSSFAIIDDNILIMRVGRGSTGVKIDDQGSVDILCTAFEASKRDATEIQTHA
jgi:sugar-specific transcriptional regulator TrmB